jgi:hypothetical protein
VYTINSADHTDKPRRPPTSTDQRVLHVLAAIKARRYIVSSFVAVFFSSKLHGLRSRAGWFFDFPGSRFKRAMRPMIRAKCCSANKGGDRVGSNSLRQSFHKDNRIRSLSYLALVIPVNFQSTFLSANDLMCRNCRERTADMLCQRALSPFCGYNITS